MRNLAQGETLDASALPVTYSPDGSRATLLADVPELKPDPETGDYRLAPKLWVLVVPLLGWGVVGYTLWQFVPP